MKQRSCSNRAIGVFLPPSPREQALVRNDEKTFAQRLEAYFFSQLFPERFAIRGHHIAVENLTNALIQHGSTYNYNFLLERGFSASGRDTLRLQQEDKPDGPQIRVTSVCDLLNDTNEHRFDGLFDPSGHLVLALTLRDKLKPTICPVTALSHALSLHSMLFNHFIRLLLNRTYQCDSIICASRASRDAQAKLLEYVSEQFNREFNSNVSYNGRIDVIPLCVDIDRFKPQDKGRLRRTLRLPERAMVILYLGYVSPLKAELLPLIQVLQALVEQNINRELLLVIAGTVDKQYLTALHSRIAELSLCKHVCFIENLPERKKSALMAASDIFVSPADNVQESFGLTLIEAMACGIPQVAADWDGYRDTVSHGETGFLVPTCWTKCDSDLKSTGHLLGWEFDHFALGQSVVVDVAGIQACLQQLIRNNGLRHQMARRSRERAEMLFSFQRVVREYEQLWCELADIARSLTASKVRADFDIPQYFNCFSGYASHIIGDETELHLMPLGMEADEQKLDSLLHTRHSVYRTIDRNLVSSALAELKRGSRASGGDSARLTFGELVITLTTNHASFHPDYIRRNLMWLLKNGLVRADVPER